MMRFSFEQVSLTVKPIIKRWEGTLERAVFTYNDIAPRQQFLLLLTAMGWTEQEYDNRMMEAIEEEWDRLLPQLRKPRPSFIRLAWSAPRQGAYAIH